MKLQDGQVIQCQQDHMKVHLYSSEPMSPISVNNTGPEQIESRLPSQPDTAPRAPVHTPDTVMPENPPVQKSIFAISTPLQQSSREVEVPKLTVAISTPPRRYDREIMALERFQSWIKFGSEARTHK